MLLPCVHGSVSYKLEGQLPAFLKQTLSKERKDILKSEQEPDQHKKIPHLVTFMKKESVSYL